MPSLSLRMTGAMNTQTSAAVEGSCDPPSLANLPGQPAVATLPVNRTLTTGRSLSGWQFRVAVSVGAEYHCLKGSAGAVVLAPCDNSDRWSQLFELSTRGLLQLSQNAGRTFGNCPVRKGCLLLSNDTTQPGIGGCAAAIANGASVHWRYIDGQLKNDDRCLLAALNQQAVAGACPAVTISGSNNIRVMDGRIGTRAWKGRLCKSPCYERTGARWEDELSMPHGWCFGDFVARNASHKIRSNPSWGSCALAGSRIAPEKQECAVPEHKTDVKLSTDLNTTANAISEPVLFANSSSENRANASTATKSLRQSRLGENHESSNPKKPILSSSDSEIPVDHLREGWAAVPLMQGRRLLQDDDTTAEVQQLKAAAASRQGAHRDEARLRQQLVSAKAAAKAASEACTGAKLSVATGMKNTKAAYERAERSNGDPLITAQAEKQAQMMQGAEEQVSGSATANHAWLY